MFKDTVVGLSKGAEYVFNPTKLVVDLTRPSLVGLTKPKKGRGRPKGTKNKK